ncbi:hypothetical protein [Cohnella cellulosilytica]|uniref:Uncharacterized protein n=1 Tax=Cohnella cellulosilytica TaxID=986710 RepID=A0ABW2FN67_9BACL
MSISFLSNLPPVGESVAKLASEGSQLVADFISMYGFFAFCLALVLTCLLVPPHIYEKYYKVADVDPIEELHVEQQRQSTDPAA